MQILLVNRLGGGAAGPTALRSGADLPAGAVSRLRQWATPGLGGEASHHGRLWPWPAAGEVK